MWQLTDVDGLCFPNKYSFVNLFRVAPRISRLRARGTYSNRIRVGALQESVSHNSHYCKGIECCSKNAGQWQTHGKGDVGSCYYFIGVRKIVAALRGKKISYRLGDISSL